MSVAITLHDKDKDERYRFQTGIPGCFWNTPLVYQKPSSFLLGYAIMA
jgi:hypothetical protein